MSDLRYWQHFAMLFGALWCSEGWHDAWLLNRRRIAYRARAVVVYDRVLNDDRR